MRSSTPTDICPECGSVEIRMRVLGTIPSRSPEWQGHCWDCNHSWLETDESKV
jgi:hypothetical protein